MNKMTKAQVLAENAVLRAELDVLRNKVAALTAPAPKAQPAQRYPSTAVTFKRPVKVMTLDKDWAYKARRALTKHQPIAAVGTLNVTRNGAVVTAYAVY